MSFFRESKCSVNVDVLVLDVQLRSLISGPVKGVRDGRVGVVDSDVIVS